MLTKGKRIPRILVIILTLAMLIGALSISASATVPTYDGVAMQFGDPNYASTPPESLMTITGSGTSYTANYTGSDSAYFYPDTLSLYAYYNYTTTSLEAGGGAQFATYSGGVATLHSSLTPSANINEGVRSDVYTVKLTAAGTVTVKDGSTTLVTLSFSAPLDNFPSASGATPNALMGYLPLGQYATGSGWGSPYSNGTTTTGTTPKIVGAYSATGVSLGAAGGYVQYSFTNPIPNTATNPYGVDFIVYGNAFNGNPEAAAVKISSNGTTWYDLAGSLYYSANTIRNADITYTLSGSDILYSITAPQLSSAITGTFKASGSAWYPTTARYGGVWQISGATVGASSYTSSSVTYSGVTLVKDTDTTNDYQFGYADVHINGSSYGTVVNPYTIANTGTGGDGYDISWAVDANGQPVDLSSIRYVRVYTSAAMNSTGTAMTVPGIFGETSAEVCGIYTPTNQAEDDIDPTGFATIAASAGSTSGNPIVDDILKMTTVTVPSGTNSTTLTITHSTALRLYGETASSSALISSGSTMTFSRSNGTTQYARVIAQGLSGTDNALASVTVLKVVFS
jgi:hypothetical protein